jgi:hypothetical protein
MPNESLEYIKDNYPSWMELLFLTNYLKNESVLGGYKESKLFPFKKYQVAHFKYELKEYISEIWFQKLLKRLLKNSEFNKIWNTTLPLEIEDHHLYDYEYNRFINKSKKQDKHLNFHVFSLRPTYDARFYFMVHMPADTNTALFYTKKT